MLRGREERAFFCQLSSGATTERCPPSSPLSSAFSSLTPATFISSLCPYIHPQLSSLSDRSGFTYRTSDMFCPSNRLILPPIFSSEPLSLPLTTIFYTFCFILAATFLSSSKPERLHSLFIPAHMHWSLREWCCMIIRIYWDLCFFLKVMKIVGG